MRTFYKFLGSMLLLTSILVGCANQADYKGSAEETARHFNFNWASNKLWDDGLAEVATYAAERVVYDKVRTFEYTLITVKEDFNKKFNVKTDDYKRPDLFPVMKINEFCRIPTDIYPYHYLTSLFFRREDPLRVHKITSSSQEWCGTTFKAINQKGNNFQYSFNSYWDGQGEGQLKITGDILFEDQLPYTLRSLQFKEGLQFRAGVAGLLQISKATNPTIYPAVITVTATDKAPEVGLWQVTVKLTENKQNYYWFRKGYPNILERQQTWDGRNLQLKEVKRFAYWQH